MKVYYVHGRQPHGEVVGLSRALLHLARGDALPDVQGEEVQPRAVRDQDFVHEASNLHYTPFLAATEKHLRRDW
jgi:hypothetical protein